MSVRVRFAPSPTGQVHIGNIRAAIFNWLFARHEGGQFLLRIEDTDRERSTPEAVKTVMEAMEWLGLTYDETPLYQSTRTQAHVEAAESLIKAGHAYRAVKGDKGGECVLFKMPQDDAFFHDEVKGDLRKEAKDMTDFVIVRSNGAPVFHLANVVDDVHMGITHIIRGDDHVENTFRHVALFKALGATPPKYAHLPMIVNAQGKPYSKRDGAAFVGDFREKGFLADALFNFLALLGWSPGDDREVMSRKEMIEAFDLSRVRSSPSKMDIVKMEWMNGRYLAAMPVPEFESGVTRALAGRDWAVEAQGPYFAKVCRLMQTRTVLFTDAAEWKHFFLPVPEYDMKTADKVLKREGVKAALLALRENLAGAEFTLPSIEKVMRDTEKAVGMQEGKLNQPARVAVTGMARGAGIYETLDVLGKERALARLDHATGTLCG